MNSFRSYFQSIHFDFNSSQKVRIHPRYSPEIEACIGKTVSLYLMQGFAKQKLYQIIQLWNVWNYLIKQTFIFDLFTDQIVNCKGQNYKYYKTNLTLSKYFNLMTPIFCSTFMSSGTTLQSKLSGVRLSFYKFERVR